MQLFFLKTCRESLGFGWFRKVYQNAEEKNEQKCEWSAEFRA